MKFVLDLLFSPTKRKDEVPHELASVQAELDILKAQLETTKITQEKLETVQAELQTVHTELVNVRSELASVHQTYATTASQINEIQQSVDTVEVAQESAEPKQKEETEIWKDIDEFIGFYQVSSHGNVRSVDRHIKDINGRGRLFTAKPKSIFMIDNELRVNLAKEGKHYSRSVKSLVAKTFLAHQFEEGYKYAIKHIDGDPRNVKATNLRCVKFGVSNTPNINAISNDEKIKSNVKRLSRTVSSAERLMIIEFRKSGFAINDIIRMSGRSAATIHRVLSRYSRELLHAKNNNNVPPTQLRIL